MICVSLADIDAEECLKILRDMDFAEIRIDRIEADIEDIKRIFSSHPRLIATFRPGSAAEEQREYFLLTAIETGAAYVDIEFEANSGYKKRIIERARAKGCRVIISYHDFEKTPDKAELGKIIDSSFDAGADAVKIACRVNSKKENARLLSLLENERPLVVVGLGEKGKISRAAAPFLGGLFTYASAEKGKETAEGQMDKKTLEHIYRLLKNDR
jgi:3-dehydroquinate dehydratase type I